MHARSDLDIEVLGKNIGDPVIHLDPQPLHLVPVFTFLYNLIPDLGIHARIDVNALRFDPSLEILVS